MEIFDIVRDYYGKDYEEKIDMLLTVFSDLNEIISLHGRRLMIKD